MLVINGNYEYNIMYLNLQVTHILWLARTGFLPLIEALIWEYKTQIIFNGPNMQLGMCWFVLGCGTRGLKSLHCILCLVKVKLNWTLHLGRETGTEAFFFKSFFCEVAMLETNACVSVLVRSWRINEYSIMFSLLLVFKIILNPACHRISVHVRVELLVNYWLYILN